MYKIVFYSYGCVRKTSIYQTKEQYLRHREAHIAKYGAVYDMKFFKYENDEWVLTWDRPVLKGF